MLSTSVTAVPRSDHQRIYSSLPLREEQQHEREHGGDEDAQGHQDQVVFNQHGKYSLIATSYSTLRVRQDLTRRVRST